MIQIGPEKKTYQLRGCGDPRCPSCNPETAKMNWADEKAEGMKRIFESSGGSMSIDIPTSHQGDYGYNPASDDSVFLNIFADIAKSQITKIIRKGNDDPDDEKYDKARQSVEKYLVTPPDQAFDDIVGNEEALSSLRDAIEAPVKHKKLYESYGLKMPRGALLSGPPGCGKTMFARAAAFEMKRLYNKNKTGEFICINGSQIQSMFVGATEKTIRSIFSFAKEYKRKHGHPLLVFIDEAEVLLPDRTGRVRAVASWEESQVATFLAEMDGIVESGAFVLLASNRPEAIDSAVLRDGRCDFKITMKRPTPTALKIILQRTFVGIPLSRDTTVEHLVDAALRSFLDPHKVIYPAAAVKMQNEQLQAIEVESFTMKHIISGAMATGVSSRAKRLAFTRDKIDGVPRGVRCSDVVAAIDEMFEENRKLSHEFALEEYKSSILESLSRSDRASNKALN